MNNKRLLIIVGGIIALFLVMLLFLLNDNDRVRNEVELVVENDFINIDKIDVDNDQGLVVGDIYVGSESGVDEKNDVIGDEERNIIEMVKKKRQQVSDSQLEEFLKIAEGESATIEPCVGREDEDECRASVAIIRGDKELCHYYYDGEGREQDLEESCERDVASVFMSRGVEGCGLLDGDAYYNCLNNVYGVFDDKENCVDFEGELNQLLCADMFEYIEAYSRYERGLCDNVEDEKLKKYCLKNILADIVDTDNDGLTDLEEINIYHTYKDRADTDGDGYLDGEEVKAGYNPLGEGKLNE